MQWRLIFSGWQSVGWTTGVVTCILAALALSVFLMRLERRLVSRTVGWLLLTIRTCVLAWLLLIMLRPVLTNEWDVSQTGRIVVAIDVSQSMETVDRHASTEEKLRWAVALGMLGDNLSDADLQQFAAAIDGTNPPLDEAVEDNPPAQPRNISPVQRRQIDEVIDEFNRMSRQEFVQRLLTIQSDNLLGELQDVGAVDLRLFATDQQSVDDDTAAALSETIVSGVGPSATDAVRLLSELTAEQDGNKVRGVVVFSDGRQTAPGDLASEGRRLGNLQVPVYSVPIGSRLKPRDISVASIESPEAVFLHDSAMLDVVLGTSGFEGSPVTVILERDGLQVESQTVTPASDSTRVSFSAPTDETGRFDYRVSVSEQPGELRADNNSREVSFQVVDNKGRVLLVDGDARWELRYLKNLLERDKQIELSSVVFRQPYLQLLNSTFMERAMPAVDVLREQLANTDLLIVGDLLAGQFTEEIWRMVEDAVSREGLTLIVIPGRRGFGDLQRSRALRNLLPVDDATSRFAEQYQRSAGDGTQSVFQLEPSEAAASLPMFQFADDSSPEARLVDLPGHPWICSGTPRASATVWALALNPANQEVREPVIVHQYYGFGQVIWMGIDSTWRWRQRRGDSIHHKFWGQFVRWAARNRSASGNDQVRLTLSDVVIEEHESVNVVARFSPRAVAELADAAVTVSVTPADPDADISDAEPIRSQLKPVADSPERFAGRIPPLSAGTWTVSLHVAGRDKMADQVFSELVVQPRKSPELADVSCHRDALQQLSDHSGGELIEPWDVDRLPALLKPEEITQSRISERTLWDHWSTLVVFFALLMTEWVTRKLNGLP
jgi:hypothetical protein